MGKMTSSIARYNFICNRMRNEWIKSPQNALKSIFHTRLISRKIYLPNETYTQTVQKGKGKKDDAFYGLLWLASFYPNIFYKNLLTLPIVGSYKDIWTLLILAEEKCIHLDKQVIFELFRFGLKTPIHSDLIKKYMPRIKSASNIKTHRTQLLNKLAKEFANHLGLTIRQYNKLKSSRNKVSFDKTTKAIKKAKLKQEPLNQDVLNQITI